MVDETLEAKKQIVQEGIEAINDGDAERLEELVADDVIMHGQGGQDARGAERVVPATVNNDAFPDRTLEIEQLISRRTPRSSDPAVPDDRVGLRTARFGRAVAVGVAESKSTQATVTQPG